MRILRPQSGQASVELALLLPLIAALLVGGWQLLVAAQAWSLAGTASRAAARAASAGGDPLAAARASLPRGWGSRVRVRVSGDGVVTVRLELPAAVGGSWLPDATSTVGSGAGT